MRINPLVIYIFRLNIKTNLDNNTLYNGEGFRKENNVFRAPQVGYFNSYPSDCMKRESKVQ